MKANTAAAMFLCGVALILLSGRRPTKAFRIIAAAAAGVVFALGALTLSEHFVGWNLGIDQILAGGLQDPMGILHPGRMAPSTAFCLVLLAVALLTAAHSIRTRIRFSIAAALSAAVVVIAAIPLVGFFVETLFGPQWNYMGMDISGVTGAVGFVLLGSGALAHLRHDAEMRWTLHPVATAGFVLGILLMIMVAVAAFNFTKRMLETNVAVAQRQDLVKETQQLTTAFRNLVSSQRIYVIAGDEQLLEDRPSTTKSVRESLAALRALTGKNPVRRSQLDQLEALIAQGIDRQEQVIGARRQEGFAGAAQMLATDHSSKPSREVARLLKQIQAEEYSFLTADRKEAQTTSIKVFMFLPMGVFLSLAILFLAVFFLNAGATEQREAAISLRQSESEIRQLNIDLDERVTRRTAELEAANNDLESFSYSVSHDLRAPLRAITGFSAILLEDHSAALDAEGLRYLQQVEKNARQMGQLIDDLLTFSRTGRQALILKTVRTTDVVNACLTDLRGMKENRHVNISVGELPDCEADVSLLRQVWLNLLENALKYTRKRDPAVITIGSRQEGGTDSYFVQDNGAGFDMKYADKLFGVFQRLHLADDYEGTGVGLALVQRIVQRHGGRVWSEARLNVGATFHFTLTGGQHA
jgi:signal transduction histidine kinase